jgi:opacity protein-like surface antigen
MKNAILPFAILNLFAVSILMSQSISIKPHFGYTTVGMSEVNQDMNLRVNELREITGQLVSLPDPFNGDFAWGIQIQYNLGDNYLLNLNTYYFKEETTVDESQLATNPFQFNFRRRIDYFDISFGVKYFFNYSSWKRVTSYLGGGVGFGIGWAESNFIYEDSINSVNNQSDFSSSALTAYFSAGINFRISTRFSIVPEVGYRVANLRQMEGTLKIDQNFPNYPNGELETTDNNYLTDASYDFSGFFLSLGLNFIIPLLE